MKQLQVIGVSGSIILTTDGPKKPIGNRIFSVGDYVWVHGMAAYGHESGNGGIIVDVSGIPIVSTQGGGL